MTPVLEQKEIRACESLSGHSVTVPNARLDGRAPPFGVSSRRLISHSGRAKKVSLSRLLKIPVFLLGGGFFMALCHDLPAQDDASEDAGVETSWTRARQALETGRSQMAAARFEDAEKSLRWAINFAPADSELKDEAESALYLELPGLVVSNLLSQGRTEEARLVLGRAINISAEHAQYMQQLTALEADLNKGNFFATGISVIEADGRTVIAAVNEVLREYHGNFGKYPTSLSEINKLLPPGKPPLEQFFISRYGTIGAGFQLELTNLSNHQQVLRIDHTGLLQ